MADLTRLLGTLEGLDPYADAELYHEAKRKTREALEAYGFTAADATVDVHACELSDCSTFGGAWLARVCTKCGRYEVAEVTMRDVFHRPTAHGPWLHVPKGSDPRIVVEQAGIRALELER